jgi:hypothetical protein
VRIARLIFKMSHYPSDRDSETHLAVFDYPDKWNSSDTETKFQ